MYRTRTVAPVLACAFALVLAGGAAAGTAVATAGPSGSAPVSAHPAVMGAGAALRPADDTRVVNASMTIPAIHLASLRIVPYVGTTDDWPGTKIQDRGIAASPYGKDGGVGPGQVGNYLVTGHREAAGGPLNKVPDLKTGQSVFITAGGKVYQYKITETRTTSFRSASSLAEQRAAVPGHPGERATQAMITVSTCATPEDHAAGNFWHDAMGNPEHRIDKVGVLVATRAAPPSTPTTTSAVAS